MVVGFVVYVIVYIYTCIFVNKNKIIFMSKCRPLNITFIILIVYTCAGRYRTNGRIGSKCAGTNLEEKDGNNFYIFLYYPMLIYCFL